MREDVSGNVFMLSAAALLPLLAMIGSALDMSIVYMARGRLQNACDSGVLAGRQLMAGTAFGTAVEAEADRFFNFNFPDGANGASNIEFAVVQNNDDEAELLGEASATIPTILMKIFGYRTTDISVTCDAKKDFGHNDIVLVLDVTGSMAQKASGGGGPKIDRLRMGARGIYVALADVPNTTTRYGIVPYSHTVNVARSLSNNDFLRDQSYAGNWAYTYCDSNGYQIWNCQNLTADNRPNSGLSNSNTKYTYNVAEQRSGSRTVNVRNSTWATSNNVESSLTAFRTSGNGCIEERASIGSSTSPIRIQNTVTRDDVDLRSTSSTDTARQFGRYDPGVQRGQSQVGCPSEAQALRTYASESAFQTAINTSTANVTGGTYHDVGMLWGTRFISSTGFFTANNPSEIDNVPVNKHIVFMTDGLLDTGNRLYSAHGIEDYQDRTRGAGSQDDQHIARFAATCDVARSMGITIWVIALDVGATDDIEPCASSPNHFFISDGSDLEEVFARIGQGIGRLRLTQ
ncbi:hypothetical protein A9995_00640 [Erythrobacter sp. QSSC1-22B]|uniref:Tad domain-containing protein n=1 Tax=Erythrobacter sp. QSSC1-22B TaxID=1860125 RepID=UPI0008055D48|nr:Tad domain-containing protein [Erythrobacter sp. QSSC1-22B]OBX20274.1 hypothetical protein A9995_00640 [Erythrobacter sp. QSSC1-22B]